MPEYELGQQKLAWTTFRRQHMHTTPRERDDPHGLLVRQTGLEYFFDYATGFSASFCMEMAANYLFRRTNLLKTKCPLFNHNGGAPDLIPSYEYWLALLFDLAASVFSAVAVKKYEALMWHTGFWVSQWTHLYADETKKGVSDYKRFHFLTDIHDSCDGYGREESLHIFAVIRRDITQSEINVNLVRPEPGDLIGSPAGSSTRATTRFVTT